MVAEASVNEENLSLKKENGDRKRREDEHSGEGSS